jgi:hypothetical protein
MNRALAALFIAVGATSLICSRWREPRAAGAGDGRATVPDRMAAIMPATTAEAISAGAVATTPLLTIPPALKTPAVLAIPAEAMVVGEAATVVAAIRA